MVLFAGSLSLRGVRGWAEVTNPQPPRTLRDHEGKLEPQNVRIADGKKQILRFAQDDNLLDCRDVVVAAIHDYTHTVGGGSGYSFASGID